MRRNWIETEAWVNALARVSAYNEPFKMPEAEFDIFYNVFLTRLEVILKTLRTPLINHPAVKLFWWIWVNLDPEQQALLRSLDTNRVITRTEQNIAVHPAVIQEMKTIESIGHYFSTSEYVRLVHGITPKCIVALDPVTANKILYDIRSDPKYARINRLAIEYNGNNVDDIMTYIDSTNVSVISCSEDRLILKTANGNAQILKSQWLWFNGLEFRHGGLKTLLNARLIMPKETIVGFWFKPKAVADVTPISPDMYPNLCPEVA